jgi:hypothetical protein
MATLQFLGPCPFVSVGLEGDCGSAAILAYLNMVKGADFEPRDRWEDVYGIREFAWEWALVRQDQARLFRRTKPHVDDVHHWKC